MRTEPTADHVDVLIIGAGLSGIGAAHHLQENFPDKTYTILESRESIGGTWDLFRYPGIRSDSDMYTLGYRFRPWTGGKAIADGPSILQYIRDTAADAGIDRNIRFRHQVTRITWSSADSRWTIDARRSDTGERVTLTAGFVMTCSGYYRYDEGYTPYFAGVDQFAGRVVHPQHWPEDLDCAGKRVVVIGSGATAVTLGPALAELGARVTILQRSPTYIVAAPAKDAMASALRRVLPTRAAYAVARAKNITRSVAVYELCQRFPRAARALIRRAQVGRVGEGFDIDTHLAPRYDPWDQRLCLVPDGDLFRALRRGDVEIETDHIVTFTEFGLTLRSGKRLPADIVVTATGLNLIAFGGIEIVVDGDTVSLPETMAYKGMMLSGVPNFAFVVGYTNASWTLKADLVCEYVVRLLGHMDAGGYASCVPRRDPAVGEEPFLDFAAGYVLRTVDSFPKQGDAPPWRLRMNFFRDLVTLRHGSVADSMSFASAGDPAGESVGRIP
ncbi:flavin-containing monooxygenase [Rhodococcus tukisamuensis]|uniref:Predicted flavoprotein CzcO associated with the cation diffusion facilitator CzcD n=1 Tax=Rhodococcus tukisamuensis TaxID=168276 RepID=A0A1G6X773_9NOCA|nr:NAD(P)/FAD-dependent oxidoreductase [Rhodococcus tukisamuensis]SDD74011.1 Predicted flavoprotein CzcO associated with the cation diffusion facilitator CzcD [Rhodococcus tukisamuensis]